jgi:AmiR/NasT family two-component response regulator
MIKMEQRKMVPSDEITTVTRVLIAEDNPVVFKITERAVIKKDFVVVGWAKNGQEVLDMVPDLQPDVVLMDIEMPGMDGIEASRLLMEQSPVPVVVLTSHESRHIVQKATQAGVGAYLVKPPKPRDIELSIVIAMARFNDIMQLRKLNTELKEALRKVKTLTGLIPICAKCKKIRNDSGYWEEVEIYIKEHSEALFSHGICPECTQEIYPDYL